MAWLFSYCIINEYLVTAKLNPLLHRPKVLKVSPVLKLLLMLTHAGEVGKGCWLTGLNLEKVSAFFLWAFLAITELYLPLVFHSSCFLPPFPHLVAHNSVLQSSVLTAGQQAAFKANLCRHIYSYPRPTPSSLSCYHPPPCIFYLDTSMHLRLLPLMMLLFFLPWSEHLHLNSQKSKWEFE